MEGRECVGVWVCGALIMGPRCLDFICGHQGAAVLSEERVRWPSEQRFRSVGWEGGVVGWGVGGGAGAGAMTLLPCGGDWMSCGDKTLGPEPL